MTGDNSSSKMDVLLEHEVNILSDFHQQLSAVLPLLWFIVRKKYLCSKKEIPPHKAKIMIINDWASWIVITIFVDFMLHPWCHTIISVQVNHTPDYATKPNKKYRSISKADVIWDYTHFFAKVFDWHSFK